jgi:hypothetical protein
MKMKPDDYLKLEQAVREIAHEIPPHRAWLKSPQNPRPFKDLEMRLRWDVFHAVKLNFYDYLNDEHIDTALRLIFKELDLQ